jgi:hypothetical protein
MAAIIRLFPNGVASRADWTVPSAKGQCVRDDPQNCALVRLGVSEVYCKLPLLRLAPLERFPDGLADCVDQQS